MLRAQLTQETVDALIPILHDKLKRVKNDITTVRGYIDSTSTTNEREQVPRREELRRHLQKKAALIDALRAMGEEVEA